ncbi:MAG: mechanosensitive ion channel, partial [Desulfotignum sp.]|nr:mechanosensitive ion channel [Desulfotignum sp.]
LKNLVIMTRRGVSALKKGIEETELSMSVIQTRLKTISQQIEKYRQDLVSTSEKQSMLIQLLREAKNRPDQEQSILKEYMGYQALLAKKHELIQAILGVLSKQEKINKEVFDAFVNIRDRLEYLIAESSGSRLLQRNDNQHSIWRAEVLKQELTHTLNVVSSWLNGSLLKEKWSLIKSQAAVSDVIVLMGLILAALAVFRGMAVITRRPLFTTLARQRIGYPLLLIESCMPLLIWLGIIYILSKIRIYHFIPDLIQYFLSFLLVVLLTRIALVAIRLAIKEDSPDVMSIVIKWLPIFVWGIRIFALVALFIYRFISFQSAFLYPLFLIFELLLILGIFCFFRDINGMTNPPRSVRMIGPFVKAAAVVGLIADAAGYTYLAAHWYISWGVTIVVACITLLLIYSIQDVDQKFKQAVEPETGNTHGVSYPFYWILSNGIYLIIGVLVFVALVFSWGVGDSIFPFLAKIFTRDYTLGKLQLSLSSLMFAFVVILMTYAVVRIWKQVMAEKILKRSGLSTGARESILTLSGYVVWALGILLSLTAFGLNTTSLAVVFGALSIGLGFGLQNIFNNFISGLILLFERPIQVGDVVEVGGTWGEVLKINVRSTLVQTYDNSTLIIPNSEFISSRVTNWSHKDPYIRRDLMVGVAYGSDTALVERLLMKAADHVKEVVQYPKKPVVQFIDFGQSSLDFRLRFWSTINDFLTAETRLRFEIDRLFREHDVVIPFPQRDIHLIHPAAEETG